MSRIVVKGSEISDENYGAMCNVVQRTVWIRSYFLCVV